MSRFDDLLGIATLASAGMFVAIALQPMPMPMGAPVAAPVASAATAQATAAKAPQPPNT